MREILTGDRVRLIEDVNDLSLHKGDLGTVRAIWHCPSALYEVQFDVSGMRLETLLPSHRVEMESACPESSRN
jgi:hypothetical protein